MRLEVDDKHVGGSRFVPVREDRSTVNVTGSKRTRSTRFVAVGEKSLHPTGMELKPRGTDAPERDRFAPWHSKQEINESERDRYILWTRSSYDRDTAQYSSTFWPGRFRLTRGTGPFATEALPNPTMASLKYVSVLLAISSTIRSIPTMPSVSAVTFHSESRFG